MTKKSPRITIIGAGWAGCAAAVRAVQRGAQVTVFEASRTPGGRARSVALDEVPGGLVDNGQHILIGAYTECFNLMRTVNADPRALLHRLPLDLRLPNGQGLRLPANPINPQLGVLQGIVQAKGWGWAEKWKLLSTAARWQRQGFACAPGSSVLDVCRGVGAKVMQDVIVPLCVAAFNSAPEETSGAVFLRVLHDALFTQPGASDALIARVPLGQVLPEPAVAWLQAQGAQTVLGQRITAIERMHDGGWQLHGTHGSALDRDMRFDQTILACPAWEAARLVEPLAQSPKANGQSKATAQWAQQAAALLHAPIGTVYAWCASTACAHLPPMQALACHAPDQAQFVFPHPQRTRTADDGTAQTLLAFVASNCTDDREALQTGVAAQARQQLRIGHLHIINTLMEKRATFVCHANVQRPAAHVAPGLWACGDYVQGPYPATLEGAVRSGLATAAAACNQLHCV